jgi:serine/threonine-protein kinase
MVAAPRTAPARQLKAGDRFAGKYMLTRRIAVGGMGEIWVAKNSMTAAEVALKVLRGDLERRAEAEARFRHEAQLGATMAHRNIIRVFDLLVEPDGTLILVMELLRGETLRRVLRMRNGPCTGVEAVAVMLPVLSALHHAHDMGIVHRDLKPANLLLAVDPDGHVIPKLLDFGIAKVADSSVKTMFGRVLGTPRYMSPEQIRADPHIDGRSDIFSAGILLIEMMTGSSPFRASTPSASLAAVLETEVDPDPRIDPRLWLAIKRALSKRAYERYATASEFAQALRQAIGATDAELQEALQRCAPLEGRPSFPDISPGFTKEDDDEDEGDGPPGESLEGHATDPPGANPQGSATGTNAGLPIRAANRAAKWVGVLAFAVIVPLLAIAVITRAKTGTVATPTTSAPVTNATADKANDIPPPPASTDTLEIVDSAPTAATTGHTSKSSTSSGRPPRTKSDHSTEKAPTEKKKPSVARTPDF